MTDRKNDMTNNLRIDEYRRINKERREMIKSGDISTALLSITMLQNTYAKMATDLRTTITNWSDTVRLERKTADAAVRVMERFNKNADKLLGDSIRVVLADCSSVIGKEEITDVADDNKFTSLLERIGEADTLMALKMTHDAYEEVVKTIGSYTTKKLGLQNKIEFSGSTESEVSTASSMLMRMDRIIEVLGQRKDTIVELNLKLRRALTKFSENNSIDLNKCRQLTDAEKEILKGLI